MGYGEDTRASYVELISAGRSRRLHSHFERKDITRQTVVRTFEPADAAESFGREFPGCETSGARAREQARARARPPTKVDRGI